MKSVTFVDVAQAVSEEEERPLENVRRVCCSCYCCFCWREHVALGRAHQNNLPLCISFSHSLQRPSELSLKHYFKNQSMQIKNATSQFTVLNGSKQSWRQKGMLSGAWNLSSRTGHGKIRSLRLTWCLTSSRSPSTKWDPVSKVDDDDDEVRDQAR